MKERFIVFLVILGIILGLIHLDVIGIWTVIPGSRGVVAINTLSGHLKPTVKVVKK